MNREALASTLRAVADPNRIALLLEFDRGSQSPSGYRARCAPDASLQTVSYWFAVLRKAGLVRLAAVVPVRGSVEHFYVCTDEGTRLARAIRKLR